MICTDCDWNFSYLLYNLEQFASACLRVDLSNIEKNKHDIDVSKPKEYFMEESRRATKI